METLAERSAGENSAAISSSRLDFRERPFCSFAILLPLLIGQRLGFGTRQRVKDAQPHQRHEIVEASATRQNKRRSRSGIA
jgi:hypothetical protein